MVRVIPIRSVTEVVHGLTGSRKIYICHNSTLLKQPRVALEVFDHKTLKLIIDKIRNLRDYAIKKDIKRSFIG